MCGICGFTKASKDDLNILKKMCSVMKHRGPDGQGEYISDGIALGHRRLSLVDLERGDQPIIRKDRNHQSEVWTARNQDNFKHGNYAIVMNGEIYNHNEIKEDLTKLGYSFTSKSDTEVVLVGYIQWGTDVLKKLRGMFAFAIYDSIRKELFCARDFFGIKPFYYTEKNGQFIFASEIKSILEHPAYEKKVNRKALSDYLCFQFSATSHTFFEDVYTLPQGHYLVFDEFGKKTIKQYWRPKLNVDSRGKSTHKHKQIYEDHTALVNMINDTMKESVSYHNFSDVEIGTLLSSGIDSSYNAALLSKINPTIKSFTVGFEEFTGERDQYEGQRNEIAWAKELAEKLNIENYSETISEDDYWNSLEKIAWYMDEPNGDPSAVALYFVDKLASKYVKGVLSGEGADELFGGYTIYQTSIASKKLNKMPKSIIKASVSIMKKLNIRGWHYLDRVSRGVEDWYYTNAYATAFTPKERKALLKNLDYIEPPSSVTKKVYEQAKIDNLDDCAKMQYTDLNFWIIGDIFLKGDKMSMANSLETRVPFLDKKVFNVASGLPTDEKITASQTKVALREAAKKVIPNDWAEKPKLGFPVPMAEWLKKDKHYDHIKKFFNNDTSKEYFNTNYLMKLLDQHKSGLVDNSRKIWIIYMFLLWHKVYFEK